MSSFIADAKYQELNMSFSFQDHHQDKLTINAQVQNASYQTQVMFNPDLDFNDLKDAFLSKQFRLVSKTPETLKLKIGFTNFQFKIIQKNTLTYLTQTINELKNQNNEQCHENKIMKEDIKQLKTQVDFMSTKIAKIVQKFDESQQQNIQLKQVLLKSNEKMNAQDKKIDQQNAQIESLKDEINSLKNSNQTTNQKMISNEHKMNQESQKTIVLQKKSNTLLEKIKELRARIESLEESVVKNQEEVNQLTNRFNEVTEEELVQQQNVSYIFSSKQKGKSVSLFNNNTEAEKSQILGGGFALVEGTVYKKGSSIRFKIDTLGCRIDVGLGIRSVIVGNSYQMKDYQNIGHGCFVLSMNGQSFSHSNKENNNFKSGFKFGKGDVIRLQTNEKELVFTNETKKWEFKMKMELTQAEWKEACFCVNLARPGDSLFIL